MRIIKIVGTKYKDKKGFAIISGSDSKNIATIKLYITKFKPTNCLNSKVTKVYKD